MTNKNWLSENIRSLIALICLAMIFLMFLYAFRATIYKDNKEIVFFVMGTLTGAMNSILGYYFGSSKDKKPTDGK